MLCHLLTLLYSLEALEWEDKTMFFRGIPESQFLSDKSKFVYSEDDEHLKYISRQNLYRNIGKMFTNKYGKEVPVKTASDMYDKLSYQYTDDVFDSYLHQLYNNTDDQIIEPDNLNYRWVLDAYRKTNHSSPDDYRLKNNKVSFRIYWNKPLIEYDKANKKELISETHHYYNSGYTPPLDYDYTYDRNISNVLNFRIQVGLDPGYYGHEYFPLNSKTYELSCKIRLHNIINEDTVEYYSKEVYFTGENPSHHPPTPKTVHTAQYVNGFGVNFNNHSFGAMHAKSHWHWDMHHIWEYDALCYYEGLYEHYDPVHGGSQRNDIHIMAGPDRIRPAGIVAPLIIGENDYSPGEPEGITNDRHYAARWVNAPAWEKIFPRDLIGFEPVDIERYQGFYESQFVRFGKDSNWHEYTFTFNADDYLDGNSIEYLTPSLTFMLAGLRPTSQTDSYIEVKDLEIKSVPFRITNTNYTDIDHIYLNKDGIWLPEDFVKEQDYASISLHRGEGQKIAESTFEGVPTDIFSPPIVDSASVTANYNSGTKIMDFIINGVSNPIYHPSRIISDAKILLPVNYQSTPIEFDIFDNGVATIINKGKTNPTVKPDQNGVFKAELNSFDRTYNFGRIDLNGSYQTTIREFVNEGGYWTCCANIDISTNEIYTPDSIKEYFKFYISGNNSSFFALANFTFEKLVPIGMFNGRTLNHYKITIPFMYYAGPSYPWFYINVGIQGHLKTGATLLASEDVIFTLTSRKVVEN